MRVVIISTNADEAGVPRHVETLVSSLYKNYDFTIIFGEYGPVQARLVRNGFNCIIIKYLRSRINIINDLISLYYLISICYKINPDIIHCHSTKSGMLGRLTSLLLRKKCIYTVHGWGWRGLNKYSSAAVYFIEYIFKYLKVKYIYVSKSVQREAEYYLKIKSDRGIVIYNGVEYLKPLLPYNVNKILKIVMPARVDKAKDHYSLVLACNLFKLPCHLVFCGNGTNSNEFVSYINLIKSNNVTITFMGEVSNVEDVINSADVIALISNFEALPISILEAMSLGKAIIASNVGGIPELIKSGTSGILVTTNSPNLIATALNQMISEANRNFFGKNAHNNFKRNFNVAKMSHEIDSVYRKLFDD